MTRTCARCGARFESDRPTRHTCPGCLSSSGEARQPRPGDPLTPRDLQIVRLLGEGKSNKEIAWELCLGCQTIKVRMSRIFRKTGVSNRTMLAILAARGAIAGVRQ